MCGFIQFVIFKPLSYCFEETIWFDVKASFASRPLSRLVRWYNKIIFRKGYSVPRDFSWTANYKLYLSWTRQILTTRRPGGEENLIWSKENKNFWWHDFRRSIFHHFVIWNVIARYGSTPLLNKGLKCTWFLLTGFYWRKKLKNLFFMGVPKWRLLSFSDK